MKLFFKDNILSDEKFARKLLQNSHGGILSTNHLYTVAPQNDNPIILQQKNADKSVTYHFYRQKYL